MKLKSSVLDLNPTIMIAEKGLIFSDETLGIKMI